MSQGYTVRLSACFCSIIKKFLNLRFSRITFWSVDWNIVLVESWRSCYLFGIRAFRNMLIFSIGRHSEWSNIFWFEWFCWFSCPNLCWVQYFPSILWSVWYLNPILSRVLGRIHQWVIRSKADYSFGNRFPLHLLP